MKVSSSEFNWRNVVTTVMPFLVTEKNITPKKKKEDYTRFQKYAFLNLGIGLIAYISLWHRRVLL